MTKIFVLLFAVAVFTMSFEPVAWSKNSDRKRRNAEAKEKCLKENPNMKGRELKRCVRNKR